MCTNDLQEVTSQLLTNSTLNAPFPNNATLASLQLVLPVSTVAVEHSFGDKRQVKTRLMSQVGEKTYSEKLCGSALKALPHLVTNWTQL